MHLHSIAQVTTGSVPIYHRRDVVVRENQHVLLLFCTRYLIAANVTHNYAYMCLHKKNRHVDIQHADDVYFDVNLHGCRDDVRNGKRTSLRHNLQHCNIIYITLSSVST